MFNSIRSSDNGESGSTRYNLACHSYKLSLISSTWCLGEIKNNKLFKTSDNFSLMINYDAN